MQVKKQQLEPDMEQWTGSNLGKEFVKAVYCHPAYLTYMQITLCEMPGWKKQGIKLGIKIAGRNINNLRYAESIEELKSLLMKVKEESEKAWLKTQQRPQDWKRSVFILIPKKGNDKECSNYRTTALISNANKVMLKILHARLQQHVNQELPDVQTGFRKGRGTRG